MDESVEEELKIQEESTRPPAVLSGDAFLRPIGDLCRDQLLVTLPPSARIAEAIDCMQERRIGAVLVVVGEKLAGIVTERDILLKVVGSGLDPEAEPVSRIMTPDPETLRLDDQLAYLLNTMRVGGFRHVPIVDEHDRPIRLISLRDVLAYIVDRFPQEILNIPSRPFRGTPPQYSG
jgi:signal-transduction protein with cAMP-binding, CBS, and nucleotidyltransferase domain